MDFQEGEIILIDKPLTWTSFDAVNKIRWNIKQKLGVKKIKVGHAGTLDPLATGLLIICTGKKTKTIDTIQAEEKTYTGTILLGKTTPSFDLETEYNKEFPTEHITAELMEKVRQSFLGEQQQQPPVFSAKQIDGKRAYEHARAGREIEMKFNTIHISDFKINASRFPEIDFEIKCSKGTYIRSIANDFGQKLNSGGTLIALRRTQSGNFLVENAFTVEDFISKIHEV
ncbi:MAG: tRNA pseudouridine(55) synthase TruB [Flavobacteriia bacterium]